ncbi:TetR/AcrR family transcriptional regulator [Parafrankia elaeagni]|uniref:TetR/AcrR family transcriptional regulator n=1 Tax=Parafrankia elaeagni TaxID=222534 RepID=UPI000554DF9A
MASDGLLRERLIAVGVEMLDAEGLGALGLRAIARRAGVSHGAPRRYFPTRAALLAAIAAEGLSDLSSRFDRVLSTSSPAPDPTGVTFGGSVAADRAVRVGIEYVRFARARPGMFELMFRHDLLIGSGENLRSRSLPMVESWTVLVAAVLAERSAGQPPKGPPTSGLVVAGPGTDGPPSTSSERARRQALLAWTHLHGIAVLAARHSLDLVTGSSDPTDMVVEALGAHLFMGPGPAAVG